MLCRGGGHRLQGNFISNYWEDLKVSMGSPLGREGTEKGSSRGQLPGGDGGVGI